jgi:hypothetical protein
MTDIVSLLIIVLIAHATGIITSAIIDLCFRAWDAYRMRRG